MCTAYFSSQAMQRIVGTQQLNNDIDFFFILLSVLTNMVHSLLILMTSPILLSSVCLQSDRSLSLLVSRLGKLMFWLHPAICLLQLNNDIDFFFHFVISSNKHGTFIVNLDDITNTIKFSMSAVRQKFVFISK